MMAEAFHDMPYDGEHIMNRGAAPKRIPQAAAMCHPVVVRCAVVGKLSASRRSA